MAEQMTAVVKLETGMQFDAVSGSGHHITLDAAEHGGGHNARKGSSSHTYISYR